MAWGEVCAFSHDGLTDNFYASTLVLLFVRFGIPILSIAFESFSQSYSKASSLSYTSGVADFDSVNNFAKEDSDKVNVNSNLEQAKEAIVQAKTHLDTMVGLLQKEQQESGN